MAGQGNAGGAGSLNLSIPVDAKAANLYIPSLATSSLKSFYDDVVYWEIAKGTNKFFVTFERGQYAIKNNGQESIATIEIDFPHTNNNSGSLSYAINFEASASKGGSRNNVSNKSFFQEAEVDDEGNADFTVLGEHHGYDGFITATQIKGDRFWQSTITSSIFKNVTFSYEAHNPEQQASTLVSRSYKASYFYPFSQYQLSVLRKSPTIIVDLDLKSEFKEYKGENGFVAIPQQTHEKIKKNLEFYLEKAGIIEKTVRFKAPKKGK